MNNSLAGLYLEPYLPVLIKFVKLARTLVKILS